MANPLLSSNPLLGTPTTTAKSVNPLIPGGSASPQPNPLLEEPKEAIPTNPLDFAGGWIGNLAGGVVEMGKGITGLLAMAGHDMTVGVQKLLPGEQEYENDPSRLLQMGKAITGWGPGPSLLVEDYKQRYGSLGGLLRGLYEDPVAYINDALMIAAGAGLVAKAGRVGALSKFPTLVPDIAASKILGPALQRSISGEGAFVLNRGAGAFGTAEKAGGIERLPLSTNIVMRGAQRAVYRGASLTPEQAIQIAGDSLTPAQAYYYKLASDAGRRVMRPGVQSFFASRTGSKILSGMRVAQKDISASAFKEYNDLTWNLKKQIVLPDGTKRGYEPELLLEYQGGMAIPVTEHMPSLDPIEIPSTLPELSASPLLPANEAADSAALARAINAIPPDRAHGIRAPAAPHSGVIDEAGNLMPQDNRFKVMVANMDDAEVVGVETLRKMGYEPIGKMDYLRRADSEYEGFSVFGRNQEGHVIELSMGTPDVLNAQRGAAALYPHLEDVQAEADRITELLANDLSIEPGSSEQIMLADRLEVLAEEIRATKMMIKDQSDIVRARYWAEKNGQFVDPEFMDALSLRPWIARNISKRWIDETGGTASIAMNHAYKHAQVQMFYRDLNKWRTDLDEIIDRRLAPEEAITEAGQAARSTGEVMPDITDLADDISGEVAEAAAPMTMKEKIIAELKAKGIEPQVEQLKGPKAFETLEDMPKRKLATEEALPTQAEKALPTPVAEPAPRPVVPPTTDEIITADMINYLMEQSVPRPLIETIMNDGPNVDSIIANARRDLHDFLIKENGGHGTFPKYDWKVMRSKLDAAGQPNPFYFPDFSTGKPSNLLRADRSKGSIALSGRPGMSKSWEGTLFETGRANMNAEDIYKRAARIWVNHQEVNKYIRDVVATFGRKTTKQSFREAEELGLNTGEVLVNLEWVDTMVNLRAKMLGDTLDNIAQGDSIMGATISAADEMRTRLFEDIIAGLSNEETYAIPRKVAEKLQQEVALQLGNKMKFWWDKPANVWKASVLSLSPRWVLNNFFGNTIFIGIENPAALRHAFGQMSAKNESLARTILPDIIREVESGFYHTEAMGVGFEIPSMERATRFGQWAIDTRAGGAVRGVSRKVRDVNSFIEESARRGVLLSNIQKMNIRGFGDMFMSNRRLLIKIAREGVDPLSQDVARRAIEAVDKTLGNFMSYGPIEQGIIRRFLMPFYGFYRHMVKVLVRMPFEHPFKARVLAMVDEINNQMESTLPEYLQDQGAVNLGNIFGGESLLRLKNLNPLSQMGEALPMMSLLDPRLKIVIERGLRKNTFTGGNFETPEDMIEDRTGRFWHIERDGSGRIIGVRPDQAPLPGLFTHIASQFGIINMLPSAQLYPKSFALNVASWAGLSMTQPARGVAESKAFEDQMRQEALEKAMRGEQAPSGYTNPYTSGASNPYSNPYGG